MSSSPRNRKAHAPREQASTVNSRGWRWPLPAVLAWLGGWAVVMVVQSLGAAPVTALLLGLLPSFWMVGHAASGWRRVMVLAGLPLSLALVQGAAGLPPWAWLLAGAALLLIYPVQAWRDAPLFPTPRNALEDLGKSVPLAPTARILDAGSGLGDGLLALRRAYPTAHLEGVEGGWLMAALSRVRVPAASIRRGDFWAVDWTGFDLVYLFQRPESMERAWHKARDEMASGAWMVSLEFEVPQVAPHLTLTCPDGRPLWMYRVPPIRDLVPADSITAAQGR